MESLAAAEKLRSALMASMSHDFRTPLATIMASASSLQAQGQKFSPATRTDLLASIQEEAERLSRFVGNILDMTRLDADALHVRAELTDPVEAVEAAASRVSRRLAGRRLAMQVPAAVPSIRADRILLEQAITNVLENAISHTKPTATIRLGCSDAADKVVLWIEDDGPGVPVTELSHIFDKFYRIDNPSNAGHGAGLGLAISKGFAEAMGANVTASRATGSETGLRIEFAFPRLLVEPP
jgi:two-component system sensor histidine kinase KdpD